MKKAKDFIKLAGVMMESAAGLKRRLDVTDAQLDTWQKKGLKPVMIGQSRYFDPQVVDRFVLHLSGM